tara:strand:- start:663 stop:842 length:180 start_codon:yes stop_codon:yes gene_type:complete
MELKIIDYQSELSKLKIKMDKIYDNPKYKKKDLDELDNINLSINNSIIKLSNLAKTLNE